MKLTKLFLTAALVLTFSTTANAQKYKMNTCIIAETSFWDAHNAAYGQDDQSFVDALGEENKIAYLNLHKSKLIKEIEEVRKRCKTMDKDIQSAYDKKMNALDEAINKL